MDPISLGIVRLGNDRMESLIVEVGKNRIHALRNAVNRAVVQVEEAKGVSGDRSLLPPQ